MKLRVRSTETKETIRIEAPNTSSLLDLKTLISSQISSSSSSSPSIPPQSIVLSLNRNDELVAGADDDLHSLGLTSGDLLFYSLSQTPLILVPDVEMKRVAHLCSETLTSEKNPNPETLTPVPEVEMEKVAPLCPETVTPAETPNSETLIANRWDMKVEMEKEAAFPAPDSDEDTEMEVEEGSEQKSRVSVPCFLRRVMELEKDGIKGNLGLLVVAVHAVFLESGFVVCDGIEPSRLPKYWNLATVSISLRYTVPDLVDPVKVAVLKFSSTGKFVSVYGYLSGVEGPDVHRLCLDSSKVAPLADLVSPDGEKEKEVFNLWKVVKDGLCLPLLIDICEKNGLPFPPCFARLPTDLKFMILELLPGIDVAMVGCVSSELRYLSGNDELWKQKFVKEFGVAKEREAAGGTSWKEKFKKYWVKKRNAEMMRDMRENVYRAPQGIGMPRYPPSPFAPLRFPMWGGDYDAVPFIGGSVPIGGLGFPHLPRRRNFIPHCNLGGRNHDFIG